MSKKIDYAATAVLAAVVVLGAYQFARSAMSPDLKYPTGKSDFWQGRMTQTLEKELDHKLPARETLIAFANSIRYFSLRSGGDQVRVGENGWLFLTDELKYEGRATLASKADPMAALASRLDLIAETSRRLQGQGVRLVVALVPDKARVYARHLPMDTGYPTYNQDRFGGALKGLRERQVAVVDINAPMALAASSEDLYYRTDTHWNQAGAQLAAKEIAKAVGGMQLGLDAAQFATKSDAASKERPGDLIRLMGVEHVPAALRPRFDSEAAQTTAQTSVDAATGLFGTAAVPVVLAGTSYSMRGNFHGHLQAALSAKVLNTAKDGGGFLQAMTAYLKDDAFKLAKPKLIVWEIPERVLRTPLDTEAKFFKETGL